MSLLCNIADLLDLAVEEKIIQKSGSWFAYGKIKLGQGRDRARAFLEEDADAYKEIRNKVLEAKGMSTTDLAPVAAAEDAGE